MGMILRIASSRIVGQGDIVGRSGYFSLNLSANSVMRGRLDARRTLKSLVADLRSENQCGACIGNSTTNGNAWRQVSKGIWTACRRKHAAASCWGCSPPSRCLPFTPSAEPSMTSAGTTAHIWKRDTPDGWNCRPRRKQAIT